MRLTNVVKNISKLLKNNRMMIILGTACILGGNVWGTDYIYNGSWSPSTPASLSSGDTATFNADNDNFDSWSKTIPEGATVIISSGVSIKLSNGWTNNGTIKVESTAALTTTSAFTNNGTLESSGTVSIENGITNIGTIIISSGSMAIESGMMNTGSISNSGTITSNNGTITNNGTIESLSGTLPAGITGTGSTTTAADLPTDGYTWLGNGGDSNWTNAGNWWNGTAGTPAIATSAPPSDATVYFLGTSPTTVTINQNISIDTLITGAKGSQTVTFDTSNYELSVNTLYIAQTDINGNNISNQDSNTVITGSGKLSISDRLDFPTNKKNTVTIDSNATFYIANNAAYFGDNRFAEEKFYFAGNGTLSIPGCGANLEWGDNNVDYANTLTILPSGPAEGYTVTVTDNGFPSANISIVITRKGTGGDGAVEYPFITTITNTDTTAETYTINSTAITNGTNTTLLSVPYGSENATYTLDATTISANGDGIHIVIKTPDGALDLAVIDYIDGSIYWKGTAGTAWENVSNWSGITDISDLNGKDITINRTTNMPVISSTVNLSSLTITANATVTIANGGQLTTDKLICQGNSFFKGDGGSIKITDEYSATYPGNNYFSGLEIATTNKTYSDLVVNGDFTNSGSGNTFSKINLQGTKDQKFTANGDEIFNLLISKTGGSVTFTNAVNITAFDDSFSSYDIKFDGDVTLSNDITLNADTVTFGQSQTSTNSFIFAGTGEQTLATTGAGTISIPNLVNNNSNKLTITGNISTANYSGTGALHINGGTFGNTGSELTLSSLTLDTTNTSTLNGGTNGIVVSALSQGNLITQGKVTVAGSLSSLTVDDGSTTTLSDDLTLLSLSIDSTGTLNSASHKITFTGTSSLSISNTSTVFNDFEIATGAALTTSSDFKVAGNWTNNGTFTASSGEITFTSSPTITGENTFNTVTFTAGQTVQFEAGKKQTIGTLKCPGTTGNEITLTTTASSPSSTFDTTWWILSSSSGTPDTSNITYTNIQYSKSENQIIKDWGSVNTKEGILNSTENWFVKTFYWWGKTDNSWDTAGNWSISDTTFTAVANAPAKNTTYLEFEIAYNDPKILILDSSISAKSLIVKTGTTVDIAAQNITTTDGITNNGTLRLKGTAGQTISGSMTNGTGSTIEYYDAIAQFVWDGDSGAGTAGKQYQNLNISGTCTTDTSILDVAGTTTINAAGYDVTLNAANIFTGGVTITAGQNITLNSASGFAINAPAGTPATCDNLTINGTFNVSNETNLTSNVTLNNATVAGSSDLKITGTLTTANTSSSAANITVSSNYENTGTFYNDNILSVSGDFTDSGTWGYSDPSSPKSIKFTGTGTQTITLNSSYNYPKIEIDKTGGDANFIISTIINNLSDSTTNACNITFASGYKFTSDTILNTTGRVTFGDIAFAPVMSGMPKSFKHTAGSTIFNGTVTGLNLTLADATFAKDITVNSIDSTAGTIQTTGNLTFDAIKIKTGDITTTGNLTLKVDPSNTESIISTGNVVPTTNNTDTLTLESTNISFISIGNGTTPLKYALVQIGITGKDLTLDGNTTGTTTNNINASKLVISGKNISTSNITFNDELEYDTSDAISLNNITVKTLTIPSTAASVTFTNTIKQTNGDFTIDYPATLTGETSFIINAGKFILDDFATASSVGSLTPTANTDTLTISAYDGIFLNNNIADSEHKFATLSLNNNVTISDNFTLYADKVDFTTASSLSISPAGKTLTIAGDAENTSGSITLLSSAIITGSLTNNDTFTNETDATLDIIGNLNNNGVFTAKEVININGDLTNAASKTFTAQADISIKGNFTDDGTWDSSAGKTVYFNGTTDQTFTPNSSTNYHAFVIDKSSGNFTINNILQNADTITITAAANVLFSNNATIATFEQTTASNIIFNKPANITTYKTDTVSSVTFNDTANLTSYTDTANTAALTFNNSATFQNDVTFNCPNVTFDGSAQASAITVTFNDGTADTSLTQVSGGTLTLTNANLTTAAISLDTVTATGNITSSDTVNTTKLTLTGDLTATNAITLGTASVNGVITTSDTFDATTFTLSGTLTATNAITIGTVSVSGTIQSTSSTISTSETTTLTGDTTYSATGNITFTDAVTGQYKLSLTGNDILFNSSVNTTNQDITITCAKCTFNNKVTGGNLSIKNSDVLSITDITADSDTDTFDFTVTSFTQTSDSTGTISISGDINASNTISFSNAVQLVGDVKLSATNIIEFTTPSPSAQKDITSDPALTYKLILVGPVTNSRPTDIKVPLNISGDLTNSSTLTLFATTNITENFTNNATFTNETNAVLTISKNLNNNGTFTSKEKITISGNLINAASKTFTAQADISIKGNFTDDGTWDSSAGKTVYFNGTTDQTFTPNSSTNYHAFVIDKSSGNFTINNILQNADTITITAAANVLFSNNATIATFEQTTASNIIFNKPANITTYKTDTVSSVTFNDTANLTSYTDTANTAALTFNNSATFQNDVTFNCPNVTFDGSAQSSPVTVTFNDGSTDKNLSQATGGTLTLTNANLTAAAISLDTVTATGNITSSDTVDATNLTLSGTLTATNAITLGTVNVDGTITSSSSSVTTNDKTTLTGVTTYNAATDIIFGNDISGVYNLTLNAPSSINIKNTTVNKLTFSDTTSSSNDTSTAIINLNGNLATTQNLTFPFNTNITGNSTITCPDAIFPTYITLELGTNTLNVTAYTLFNGTLNGTATLTVTGDLIIKDDDAGADKIVSINTPVDCKENIVLYGGELKISANISAEKDLVLYGTAYSEKDLNSEIDGIYKYNDNYRQNHISAPKVNFIKTVLPASAGSTGATLPTTAAEFSGILTTIGAVTIKAGQNFYANGLVSTGTSEWNLTLKANRNAIDSFAEAFNCDFTASSCIVSSHTAGANADSLKIAAENCTVKTGYESGWDLEDFIITDAWTTHDNLIRINFNRNIRTADNEFASKVTRIKYQADSTGLQASYKAVFANDNFESFARLKPEEPVNTVFLCAQENETDAVNYGIWNTDATGISAGLASSKDTHKIKQEAIPYIDIQRNEATGDPSSSYSYFITDEYGKRLIQYHASTPDLSDKFAENKKVYTNVTDKCLPVLISIKTGQEIHEIYDNTTGEASQHSYDSHNFIEFTYSESVNLGDADTSLYGIFVPAYNGTDNNVAENFQVTVQAGQLTGDITKEGPLNFAGLGTIANGKLHTGKNGTTDATVNAFYRDNPYSIKLSIAGWTDGTVTDKDGHNFKNWAGYIESAVMPTGEYKLGNTTPVIFDLCGNPQKETSETIIVDSNEDGIYGVWDISEPVFALCRLSTTTPWGDRRFAEAVGTGSGSTLDRIEFHFFDNTPSFTENDPAAWFTQKGWCINTSTGDPVLIDSDYSYCADDVGGARPFDKPRRTYGGIRFSTTAVIPSAFKYSKTGSKNPDSPFIENISGVYPTVTSPIFTGSSSPRRSADDPDGLYFGLGLPETNLPVETTFTVSYDETTGYLTDLAGNRLRSDLISTIDRTPPSLDMSLSPINQDELFVIFVKELVTDSSKLMYLDSNGNKIQIAESYEEIIPYCFDIISIENDGTPTLADIQVDRTTPAKIQIYAEGTDDDLLSKSTFTFITLKLTRNLTLKDIQTLHLRLTYPEQYTEKSTDPVTSIKDARVTLIQDAIGNYTQMYTAHALSEFLIGGITPMYAYDSDMNYGDETIMNGLYEDGSWAVHDFEADQQNYGTLPQNHPIAVGVQLDDGTTEQNNLPANVRIFLSNAPDSDSVSSQLNADFSRQLRVWLPSVTDGLFPGFALSNNTNYSQVDSKLITDSLKDGLLFDIPKDITSLWASGDQVSFLFGLLNNDGTQFRFYNAPFFDVTNEKYDFNRSAAVPLYSMRLHDPADILSLDLWSFKLRSITEQRGGVTILNNVINSNKGEKVVVKVNTPSDGKLNVIVMTLDGNIVQYLAHGQTKAGEHYYSWNGKNKNGAPVARGMYFIRVVGNGFDETRKVMVVK